MKWNGRRVQDALGKASADTGKEAVEGGRLGQGWGRPPGNVLEVQRAPTVAGPGAWAGGSPGLERTSSRDEGFWVGLGSLGGPWPLSTSPPPLLFVLESLTFLLCILLLRPLSLICLRGGSLPQVCLLVSSGEIWEPRSLHPSAISRSFGFLSASLFPPLPMSALEVFLFSRLPPPFCFPFLEQQLAPLGAAGNAPRVPGTALPPLHPEADLSSTSGFPIWTLQDSFLP